MSQNRIDLILKYFPRLTPVQLSQFEQLGFLYPEWNTRINVISRKDIGQLYLHHLIHSLSIAKIVCFKPGTSIMDAGTGGGFPGIPLAVFFPETQFTLVDSITKKIKVVEAIARDLNLKNVITLCSRNENVTSAFDFITGRAVTDLKNFFQLVRKNVKKKGINDIPNGILYLKGGELEDEIRSLPASTDTYQLSEYFTEDFFLTKKLVHIHNF